MKNDHRPKDGFSRDAYGSYLATFLILAVLWTGPVLAQTPILTPPSVVNQAETPSPTELKKLSLEELMNLDVTSVAKEPQPYGQAPAAIEVITNDEIRRSGASSIPEALQLADNLEVTQSSSSNWDISARGFNAGLSDKLLVLMDGRTVYSPLDAGVFWNAQDYLLEDLDRIEVVSGPGGTLWGANAVNGVINIISKDAKDTQGAYVEGGGGTELQDFTGARYGGTLAPDVYYRVYAKYFNRGNELYANGNNASDAWDMGQGGFRVDDEADLKNKFTLQGDLYASSLNAPGTGSQAYNGGNILGRWTHTISDDSNMSLQLYFDQAYINDPMAASSSGPAADFADNLDTYDLDFQHHFSLDENNRFTWGVGYRFTDDVVQNASAIAFIPPTLDQSLYSGFAQDEFMFATHWALTLGSKIEHNDYTGFEFEPSARLAWTPSGQLIWAAVSRAVRMPSRIDVDTLIPNSATPLLTGNPNFLSETVIAYELGYRAQLSHELSASLSTFFNNYNDLRSISLVPGATGRYIITNNLEAQTWGAELTADYQVMTGWRLHAGYDQLNENVWIMPGGTDVDGGLEDTADPPNQVFLRSSMDLPYRTQLDLAFRWIDAVQIYSSSLGTVPSYAELNARLGWNVTPAIELSVVGQNLLQNEHPEYGFPRPTQEQIARSVYGKLACRF